MHCGPEILDELEFSSRRPWHRMGLHRIDVEHWLPPCPDPGPTLRARRRLLSSVPDEVVVVGGISPGVLDRVSDLIEPHGEFASPSPDRTVERFAADRFGTCAAAIVDDICVVERRGDDHVMTAGAVFFPSRWSLRSKVDRSVRAIHGPVPDDGADLHGRTGNFMSRIRVGTVWERTNWFVHDRPVRWAPRPPRVDREVSDRDPPRLWLRSERQTLRPIDDAALIFTIRTRLARVEVFRERPAAAAALLDQLATMPAGLVAGKVRPVHLPALVAYLGSCL